MVTLYQKPVPVNMGNPTTGRKKAKLAIRIWYTHIIAFSVEPFACPEELWPSKINFTRKLNRNRCSFQTAEKWTTRIYFKMTFSSEEWPLK